MPKKRITPEAIAQAVTKTGLLLVKGTFGNGVECGCGLTALFIADDPQRAAPLREQFQRSGRVNRDELGNRVVLWADTEFGEEYRTGFMHAFDGSSREKDGGEYVSGHDDGRYAACVLQPISDY